MKKKISKLLIIVIGIVLFSGCNSSEGIMKKALNKRIPPEDNKFAQEYVEIIRNHEYEKAITLLSPQIKTTVKQADLEKIASFLDSSEIIAIENTGCDVFISGNKKQVTIGYQYQFVDSWTVVSVVVENISGDQQILGIHVNPLEKALKEINAFNFVQKKPIHFIFLIIMSVVALLIIYALILCIKSKIRKKWLWIILIFVGVGQISLNWTTGQIFLNLLSINIQLFGVATFKGGLYAPWIMKAIIPVGAIIFLIKRNKLIEGFQSSTKNKVEKDKNI